ncbi:MAG: SDR family oxidoreductase [Clostridia bacterium]|nr:SDR family oxidoreductase [Clostridia bacterium]
MEQLLLKGKKALVTGASRGIGSAIALELARAGADVTVHYAGNAAAAQAICDQICAMGRQSCIVQADLSDLHACKGLIDRIGPVDILVLNASVQIKKPWETITDVDFDIQMNCNLRSSMKLIQQAVPHMRQKKWGRIVTIGSVQEAKPHPDMLVYSATKAAQTMMVKSLALQVAADGITINNVAPGVIYTDRNVEALSDPEYAKKVTASIPVGYYGEKEDCAYIVRLLCSDEGRYITGQSYYVDGGKSL